MRRREFITLIGGTAAWPLAAGAQQRTNTQKKTYRIGFLFAGTIALRPQAQEFWRKLQELGYIEGKNFIAEIKPTLSRIVEEHISALFVLGDPLLFDRRADVIAFSLANRGLTFHSLQEEAIEGAVAAYGVELADEYRRAAPYVAKILTGAAPADLPVDQAIRYGLALNLRSAKTIGVKIPESIVLRADKLIE